jgi:hypothetical protein
MQVKVFSAAGSGFGRAIPDTALAELESRVNEWLKAEPQCRVVEIRQSSAGGSWGHLQFFLTVWYNRAE